MEEINWTAKATVVLGIRTSKCESTKRFRAEYLGQMYKFAKSKMTREIAIGEIVIIDNDNFKRLNRPLGRCIKLLKGKDSRLRLVWVLTSHATNTTTLFFGMHRYVDILRHSAAGCFYNREI